MLPQIELDYKCVDVLGELARRLHRESSVHSLATLHRTLYIVLYCTVLYLLYVCHGFAGLFCCAKKKRAHHARDEGESP